MPRRKRRKEPRRLPVCGFCGRSFEKRHRQITCDDCLVWLTEDERHDRPYAENVGHRPGWTHDLTPVDLLTPRMLQRLYGARLVEAANAIITRILADAT